ERVAMRITRGRTAVVVAHRLSQAAQADRILVMEDGRIVEQGSHNTLLTAGGTYASLWAAWSAR
ncbi:MAG: ABC transporter ATP-binding protein, partial [Paeniglutamicibacter terrestris]